MEALLESQFDACDSPQMRRKKRRETRVLPSQLMVMPEVQAWRRESLNGNYEFGQSLGSGGMAEVFLAKNRNTGEYVAVKAVDKRKLKPVQEARLRREYTIMKHLNHRNLIKLIEVVENPVEICIVMEYAPAGDLYEYLLRQPHCRMAEKKAQLIFEQIASALQHLHRCGFVHRDIKPENILLAKNNRVLLGDLGYGTVWDPEMPMSTSCGSLYYASPEIVGMKQYYGPEVDVWSLGVVLYVMVNGCLPFQDLTDHDTRKKIMKAPLKHHQHNSAQLRDLLSKMLDKDPEKRVSIDEILAHPWVARKDSKKRKKPDASGSAGAVAITAAPQTEHPPAGEDESDDDQGEISPAEGEDESEEEAAGEENEDEQDAESSGESTVVKIDSCSTDSVSDDDDEEANGMESDASLSDTEGESSGSSSATTANTCFDEDDATGASSSGGSSNYSSSSEDNNNDDEERNGESSKRKQLKKQNSKKEKKEEKQKQQKKQRHSFSIDLSKVRRIGKAKTPTSGTPSGSPRAAASTQSHSALLADHMAGQQQQQQSTATNSGSQSVCSPPRKKLKAPSIMSAFKSPRKSPRSPRVTECIMEEEMIKQMAIQGGSSSHTAGEKRASSAPSTPTAALSAADAASAPSVTPTTSPSSSPATLSPATQSPKDHRRGLSWGDMLPKAVRVWEKR